MTETTYYIKCERLQFRSKVLIDFFFIFMQNKCVPYWPDNQSTREAGPYLVSCTSEREATDYKVRVLEITPVDEVTSTHRPLSSLCMCYYHYRYYCYYCNLFSFSAKTKSHHLALPVHELARPRRPSGAGWCPQLPQPSEQ